MISENQKKNQESLSSQSPTKRKIAKSTIMKKEEDLDEKLIGMLAMQSEVPLVINHLEHLSHYGGVRLLQLLIMISPDTLLDIAGQDN